MLKYPIERGYGGMIQHKFEGTGWEKQKYIQVMEKGEKKVVLLNSCLYMSWQVEDEASQRIAIAQICGLNIVTQEEIAEAFGINIKSVYNYVQSFQAEGAYGLISQKRGPKGSSKLSSQTRSKILMIALKLGMLECEAIQKRLKEWNEHVSKESIRQVLLENGIIDEKVSRLDVEIEQDDFFDTHGRKQAEFNWNKSFETEPMNLDEKDEPVEEAVVADAGRRYRRRYSQAQRSYLDQIEQGYYNTYAGGLLYTPLIENHSFLPTIKKVINIETMEGYSLEELCLTLLYFDVFRYRSMEDFKRAYAEELGMLIGRLYSPSHFTLRRFLHKVRELKVSEKLIDEFSKVYLKAGIAKWGVIYIDGHFLPYYGMYTIPMGWHGVRKIPMKGSYNFIGVDEKFKPWIFLIRSSREDLLQKIPEIIEKAKEIAREIGLADNEIDECIVLFDREGYSAQLYRYLDGRDKNDKKKRAIFVSWAKYCDKWVKDIKGEEFNKRVRVIYDIQKAEEIRYYQTERIMNKYGKIRAIVIESGKDNKRAVIYTNGKEDEITAERTIGLICRRWGEENLIKALMEKHFINYFPGYVVEQTEEQPMVDNPKIKELKKKKANRANELHNLKVQLADKIIEEPQDKMALREIKESQVRLFADIASAENEILFIKQEIDRLPAQVSFDEAHGKRLLKFNYEKKRFLDCIKVCAYNIEGKMCEILLKYYGVRKEVVSALSMIVERGGYIKLEDGKLIVRLRRFMNHEINYAARHLCEDLNKMKPHTLDKFRFPIRYEVI